MPMKKILAITALFSFFALSANAQQAPGQVILSGGVGNSFGMTLLRAGINIGLDSLGIENKVTNTPVFYGAADVGITEWFSLGASYTFNQLNWRDKWDLSVEEQLPWDVDLPWRQIEPEADVRFWLSRHNIGVQALFHTPNNPDIEAYAGPRLGFSFWNVGFTAGGGGQILGESTTLPFSIPTLGVVVGTRAYFGQYFGVHGELNLGTGPYFARIGGQIRI